MESTKPKRVSRTVMMSIIIAVGAALFIAVGVFLVGYMRRVKYTAPLYPILNITAKDPLNDDKPIKDGAILKKLVSTTGKYELSLKGGDGIVYNNSPATQYNGFPTLSCNASTFVGPNGLGEKVGGTLTVFILAKTPTNVAGQGSDIIAYSAYPPAAPQSRIAAYQYINRCCIDYGTTLDQYFMATGLGPEHGVGFNVFCWRISSSYESFTFNDKVIATLKPSFQNINTKNYATEFFGATNFGDVCQLVVYDRVLDDLECTEVYKSLSSGWQKSLLP